MKVAITGAHGYIASSLIRYLLSHSIEVVGLTRSCRQSLNQANSSGYQLHDADYSNPDLLVPLITGCDVVIHVAGRVHDSSSLERYSRYPSYLSANIDVSLSIAKASVKACVSKFIFLSTISVFGECSFVSTGLNEDCRVSPVNNYSISKYHAEQLLQTLFVCSEINFCVVRIPMVYGVNCPGNLLLLRKLYYLLPFNIVSRLRSPRSFVSVRNLHSALLALIVAEIYPNSLYHICDDRPVSVSELADLFYSSRHPCLSLSIPVPMSFFCIVLSLLGMHSLKLKLCSQLLIDNSLFKNDFTWQPVDSFPDSFEFFA